jgi:5'-3' exoribonuclease 1
LKEPDVLKFPFDMERVIDDFILMAFFVGNDFLPNLPNLHINEGALALMFKVYKSVLPKGEGYINELGVINLERLALLLDELSDVEHRFFEAENADASWFRAKQMAKPDVMSKGKKKGKLVLTTPQKEIFNQVKAYISRQSTAGGDVPPLDLPTTLPARDRKFVEDLAESLNLQWKMTMNEAGDRHLQLQFPDKLDGVKVSEDDDEDEEEEESEDEEAAAAIQRVILLYEKAKVLDVSAEEAQAEMSAKYDTKFMEWKNQYYQGKFQWGLDNEVEMTKLAENYVQGLQWVLYYYYRGVASWPWFYKYHYSPMISGM